MQIVGEKVRAYLKIGSTVIGTVEEYTETCLRIRRDNGEMLLILSPQDNVIMLQFYFNDCSLRGDNEQVSNPPTQSTVEPSGPINIPAPVLPPPQLVKQPDSRVKNLLGARMNQIQSHKKEIATFIQTPHMTNPFPVQYKNPFIK